MPLAELIQAMPKVDLSIHFEGALQSETLFMLSEQNDVPLRFKTARQYNEWVNLLSKPQHNRWDDMLRMYPTWVRYADDLARLVYDLGLTLAKQQVRYAEVTINPALYTDLGMSFEGFLEAINDGRDRVMRAWGIRLSWLLAIPRDRPRKGDDISRWATGATAKRGHVVGITTQGRETITPSVEFKKSFATAQKKGIMGVTPALSVANAESLAIVLQTLEPARLTDVFTAVDDEVSLSLLTQHELPVVITPSRDLRLDRIKQIADHPLPRYVAAGIPVILGAAMPTLQQTNLTQEYLQVAETFGWTDLEFEHMMTQALMFSFLSEDDKALMIGEFATEFAELRQKHLAPMA